MVFRHYVVAGTSPENLPWGPDADQLEEAGKFAMYLNESKTGQVFVYHELGRYSRILQLSLLQKKLILN